MVSKVEFKFIQKLLLVFFVLITFLLTVDKETSRISNANELLKKNFIVGDNAFDEASVDRLPNIKSLKIIDSENYQITQGDKEYELSNESTLYDAISFGLEADINFIEINTSPEVISESVKNKLYEAVNQGILLIISEDIELDDSFRERVFTYVSEVDFEMKDTTTLQVIDLNPIEVQENISKVIVTPDNFDFDYVISTLLESRKNLTSEQIINVLKASSNPVIPGNNIYGRINMTRALEFIETMNHMDKIKGNGLVKQGTGVEKGSKTISFLNTTLSTPSFSISNVTNTSINWHVQYIFDGAWGNRLDYYDFTNSNWTDVTNTYNSLSGQYISNNLSPGNYYMGTMAYYTDKWYTIDIHQVTIPLYQAAITISNITTSSFDVHATFPASGVFYNEIHLFDTVTGQWHQISEGTRATNGTYNVTGLESNREYYVQLRWVNGNVGKYVKTSINSNLYSYEYNTKGQLYRILRPNGSVLVTYTYDNNGNLLRVIKN